jgi:hypothetical protein
MRYSLMRVLNDFHCNACGILYVDRLVDNKELTIDCLSCDGLATKTRSVPNFSLPGNDASGFPTAFDKWEKKRAQKIREELKQEPQNP